MPGPTEHVARPGGAWKWGLAVLLGLGALATLALRARTPAGANVDLPAFATDDAGIPDDGVLREQLQKAIDLRRREFFDRVLDARDPGELIEHATFTDAYLDTNRPGNDALFVVGDEMFGYLFRPENGWGHGPEERSAPDYTPHPRRIHEGRAGGPDAFGCFSCHSKGGPDGAGTQTQNAFMRGDGARTTGADQRNAPHLLGVGPVACLAREMSADLQAQAARAREQATTERHSVEQRLVAKGVAFGRIVAQPDGSIDARGVEGV